MHDDQRRDSLGPIITALGTVAAPTAAAHFAVPDQGVTFFQAHLTIIGFLLGVLGAVVWLLFRLLILSYELRIREATRLAARGTEGMQRAVEVAVADRERP